MMKTTIGFLLIGLALCCIGYTVYETFQQPAQVRIWSLNTLGAFGFHALCMIVASFLLASPAARKETREERR